MVSVWRDRESPENTPHRPVGRDSRAFPCPVGRCNGGPLCPVGRCKGSIFLCPVGRYRRGNFSRSRDGTAQPVRATLKALHGAHVVAWVPVKRPPYHGKPCSLVRALSLHRLENEPGFQQLPLGLV